METLTIELLGTIQITRSGEGAISFDTDSARALLAYLAANATRPVPREVLAGLLWPEWPDTDALRNLRTALYRLRNAIRDREADPPYLLISRDALQLNVDGDISVDVHTFDEHLRWVSRHAPIGTELDTACADRLSAAADLYRGDLMAGYSYPSAEFEEWIVAQRESYHVRMLDVLGQLASYHEQRGDYRKSLAHARRQIELEPWRESAHRQAMRASALGGQRAMAIAQYENCVRILEGELGIEPEAATRELYEQIRRGELHPVPSEQRQPFPLPTPPQTPLSPTEEPDTSTELLSIGERRIVTFLLAEADGIERPVAGTDLEVWAETRHEVLEGAREAVMRYGGTIVQTYDAGFLAAFGAEVAHEDDARRAVFAALSIMQALAGTRTPDSRPGKVHLRALSLGVATGEAITFARAHGGVAAHAIVIDQLRDIQKQMPPGTVWVTEATYGHVAEQFEWRPLGEVADTNSEAVERVYSPVKAVTTPAEHAVGGLRVPLVGRKAELAAMVDAIVRLQAGIGGVVTLVGEAGIGKSRLIAEARSGAGGYAPTDDDGRNLGMPSGASRWVEGQWLSYTEGTAYYGWQELLRKLFDLSESCTLGTCEVLEEEVRTLCPDQADAIVPYLRRLMALPEDPETAASLDRLVPTGMLRDAIFQAVANLLTCVARRTPLAIVLDDLHWADGASLALLEHVLMLTDHVPLLVIIAMRPARAHGSWQVREMARREYGHRHTDLSLGPLTPTESEVLVRSFLVAGGRDSGVDGNLVSQLQQRAEGNPFFAVEIVRSFIDEGAMTQGPPPTIEGMLAARIDRLPLESRRVLQLAAVVGRVFSYGLLLNLVSGEAPGFRDGALDEALLQLLRAQLIREQTGIPELVADHAPDRTFIFEHQLTREAAYHSLLQRKRRVLHRRVAEAQERLYPEQTGAQLGLLAYHWEQAGDLPRAVDYLERAGRQAASQYANDEALLFYSRALSLVPDGDDETRYALLLARERIYNLIGDRGAQTQDLESLATLADRAHDTHKIAEVLIRRAEQAVSVHDVETALALASKGAEMARASGDLTFEGSAYFRIGQALADPGAADTQVLDYLERALAIVRTSGPQRLEAEILIAMGVDLSRELRPEGRDMLQQALEICRATGDRSGEGRALRQLANVYGFFGDFASGQAGGLAALPILREVGDQHALSGTLYVLGYHETCLGRYSDALAHLAAAESLSQSVGDRVTEASCHTCRGIIFDELGDDSQAWSELLSALAFPTQRRGLIIRAWGLAHAALILVHQGLPRDAQTYAQRAIDFVLETGRYAEYGWLPYNRAVAHMVMGHALADLGDDEGALQAYATALNVERKAGPAGVPAEIQAALARLYMRRGDLSAALAEVEQILAYLEHGGVAGTTEPVRIYLTCYQALEAAGDPRAWGALAEGYRLLAGRAAAIDDEQMRYSYLENVKANRELAALYRVGGQG